MLDYASLRPWEWKPKTEKPKVEKPKSEKPVKTEKPPKPKKVKKRFFLIGAKGRTEIPAELANQMRSSQFYKEGSIIEE